jgi:hypothetical protein
MTDIPKGWTDDLSIVLPSGVTLDEVVEVVLRSEALKKPYEGIVAELVELGLSENDAQLAHDRSLGGLVRAATSSPATAEWQDKDPVAWTSYQRCLREPELIAAVRPQYARSPRPTQPFRTRRWWQFWRPR